MFQAERLKRLREERQLKQADIAKQLGLSRASYFNWESGKTRPNQANLKRLSEVLDVPETYFFYDAAITEIYAQLTPVNQEKTITYASDLLANQKATAKVVPIVEAPKLRYAYKVYEKMSAGTGFSYFGDGNYDTVYHDEEIAHDFASYVFGDSMMPQFLNGEVALIRQGSFDYDGAIYALEWDGQTYIKKVYREEEGLRLVSLNKKYADKFAPYDEDPRIIGKIVGHFMPMEMQ
ncbi:XRE family transcriptional regulator [Streptococcus merionis]|uniref:XRE family transcriptional regulator n=1 Tax=Streptococcus merionis TaxID=400065 RepID=UPI0026F1489B|nr:XRE family transcriptional regulator [Streptococcus merionis]